MRFKKMPKKSKNRYQERKSIKKVLRKCLGEIRERRWRNFYVNRSMLLMKVNNWTNVRLNKHVMNRFFSADIVKQTRKRKNCDDSPRHSLVLCANLLFFSLLDCRSWIIFSPVVSELTFLRPGHFFVWENVLCCFGNSMMSHGISFSQLCSLLFLQAVSISEWGSEGMLTRKSWLTKIVWELTELNKIYMGDEISQQLSWQKWLKPIELTEVEVDRTEDWL